MEARIKIKVAWSKNKFEQDFDLNKGDVILIFERSPKKLFAKNKILIFIFWKMLASSILKSLAFIKIVEEFLKIASTFFTFGQDQN